MRSVISKTSILILALSVAATVLPSSAAEQSATLTIDGKTTWHISLPSQAGRVERFAAAELTKYVRQISGARLKQTDQPDKPQTIQIALRAHLPADSRIPAAKPGFDGYSVVVSQDFITIAGDNPRGVLYGVYDLLERLGCRWYHPMLDPKDPEVVPKNPNLSLPVSQWSESARIELRICNCSSLLFEIIPERLLPQIDWLAKNRYNGVSWQAHHEPGRVEMEIQQMKDCGALNAIEDRDLILHGPGHSLPFFLATEKYFDKHPEWFGLRDGKRQPHGGSWPITNYCWSNEEANNQFIDNLLDFVTRWPQLKILYIVPIDGGVVCECPKCKARVPADMIVELFNRIADRLEKDAPGVTLESVMGYGPLEEHPKNAQPNGKWQALYAHWGRHHHDSYNDPHYHKQKHMEDWARHFMRYSICSYYAAASHQPFNGPPFLHALQGDTKYMVEKNTTGTLTLQYPHSFWWNFSFNLAMGGMYPYYYPERNPREQLREYALTYFGPQAGPIMADYLESLGVSEHLDSSYKASRGEAASQDMRFLRQKNEQLEQAANLVADQPPYAYRVSKQAAGMEILLHLAPSKPLVSAVEQTMDKFRKGEVQRAAVIENIEKARRHIASLREHARNIGESINGVMDNEWLDDWTIKRTMAEPLNRIEKELNTVTLVDDHKSDWQIVTASARQPGVEFAASELSKYISQMSECTLPRTANANTKPAILVGLRTDFSAADQTLLPPAADGYDGYAITISPADTGKLPRILIAGDNIPGTIYGVYDLLEKFGCRWFYTQQDCHDKEVVPEQADLKLDARSWAVASPIKYRICNGTAWFFDMDLDNAMKQLDWAMKCRYNAMGWQSESKTPIVDQYQRMADAGLMAALELRGMFLHGPGHAFDYLLSSDTYMKEHPESFGLRDGKRVPQGFGGAQFCWSNVEARKQFVENTKAFVAKCPRIHLLYIAPFDGGLACECDECKKIGAASLLLTLMGEVIDGLACTAPDVRVEALGGYGPVTEPPKNVQIHPKQRVVWAHWGRWHGEGYNDDSYGHKNNLELWRKAAPGGMTLCQYYTDNFAEPWILPPFARAIVSDREYFLKHDNIDSMYMLMWPPGYWWNHSLNGFLGGLCFYDVSLDPYKLLEDYALNYYGQEAGPLIFKYYDQWARNVDLAYRVKDDASPRHRTMLADQRVNFINPAVEAVKKDALLSYRVRKVQKLHRLAEKLAEAHRQRREIHRQRRAGDFEKAQQLWNQADAFTDQLLDYFYEIADLNQGLLDRNEIGWFITMGVKNWLKDEAKSIKEKDNTIKPNFWGEKLDEHEMLPAQVTQ